MRRRLRERLAGAACLAHACLSLDREHRADPAGKIDVLTDRAHSRFPSLDGDELRGQARNLLLPLPEAPARPQVGAEELADEGLEAAHPDRQVRRRQDHRRRALRIELSRGREEPALPLRLLLVGHVVGDAEAVTVVPLDQAPRVGPVDDLICSAAFWPPLAWMFSAGRALNCQQVGTAKRPVDPAPWRWRPSTTASTPPSGSVSFWFRCRQASGSPPTCACWDSRALRRRTNPAESPWSVVQNLPVDDPDRPHGPYLPAIHI